MIDNIRSQMRKGILEYCILETIARKESYATEILDRLKKADMDIVEGTLYPLLTRMKNAGMLTYRWQESTAGPPRKYFTITDEGKELLLGLEQEWTAISHSISTITQRN